MTRLSFPALAGLLLAFLLISAPAAAQRASQPSGMAAATQAFTLPTPNEYRSGSGKPGEAYWQQRADYAIRASLDPATHRISGTETIRYTNNSPTSLDYLWLQLDQNLFRAGSRGAVLQGGSSRWRGFFEGGGYDISQIEIVQNDQRTTPDFLIDDTRLRLALDEPLPPGGSTVEIEITYAFTVPEYGADRMGRLDVDQGTVYEVAQWYPRLYVYDDVNGWNPLPYLGQGEFYLDYGDYDVEITVPRDFIVVATGELQNPAEVLTDEQQRRLNRARASAETVMILRPDEIGQRDARPAGSDLLTWRFHAENVRDFSWAASQAFIWDAANWDGVLIMSAYPREGLGSAGNPGWEQSTQYARHTIQYYSEQWFRYPYPVAINVAGVVGGMEYPMIVFCSVRSRDQGLFGVTDHELGHSWFPMIVGSDERRYAWMDEGFNTFINYYSNLAFYGQDARRTERVESDFIAARMKEEIADQPSSTYPDQIRRDGLGFLAYRKPGKGLIILREYVLGPKRFDAAFREYIRRWAYKHPQPADFFRTIEDAAGEDLDWFWQGWFNGTGKFDQAVEDVALDGNNTVITLANREALTMPVELEVTYADGSSERRRIPIEAWATGNTYKDVLVDRRDVVAVQLDPDGLLPDIDRSNDHWQKASGAAVPPPPQGG